jgi:glycosyltransferase involved in cell wall biosynthesis
VSLLGTGLGYVAIGILLTHPHFWPYVRRGAEREVHAIGTRLQRAGHDVRLVTSTPRGLIRTATVDGLRVRYLRAPGRDTEMSFGRVAALATAVFRPQLVHCFFYSDAAGAARARSRNRPVIVLKLTGTVRPEVIDREPRRAQVFRRAVHAADEVWCNSPFARAEMTGFGVDMRVVPAGVDLEFFRPTGERAARPTVLCTAAAAEPRKRVVDLLAAWPAVLAVHPDAECRLAGDIPDRLRAELRDRLPAAARPSVRFLGPLTEADLVGEYAAAWVTAAPAVKEALGLATLESLACGTPVVGARSGATADLLADPAVGTLFEPAEPADCARALLAGLALADQPRTAAACRVIAQPYDWTHVLQLVEDRYSALTRRR